MRRCVFECACVCMRAMFVFSLLILLIISACKKYGLCCLFLFVSSWFFLLVFLLGLFFCSFLFVCCWVCWFVVGFVCLLLGFFGVGGRFGGRFVVVLLFLIRSLYYFKMFLKINKKGVCRL